MGYYVGDAPGLTERFHELKTWPLYFRAVVDGVKTFEIRLNDRWFQEGDILILEEYDPITGYTGKDLDVLVTYVLHLKDIPGMKGWAWEVCRRIMPDLVVMAIKVITEED